MPQPHRASSYHNIKQPYLANVKIEIPASPDLVFPPPQRALSALGHGHNTESYLPRSIVPSSSSSSALATNSTTFSPAPFNFMADYSWHPSSSAHSAAAASNQHSSYSLLPVNAPSQPIYGLSSAAGPYSNDDEYDDDGDLTDMNIVQPLDGGSGGRRDDRLVRKRSSKACDQCRKSKCKCERTSSEDPCKNCIMLNTACTFLGPSRKRGPPKGYIDAIEARLHQTEALLGIFLASRDPRALSLLEDVRDDPLAQEIIKHVDESPYGVKGRLRGAEAPGKRNPPRSGDQPLATTHPSNEWQDKLVSHLHEVTRGRTVQRDGRSMSSDASSSKYDGLVSRGMSASPARGSRQVRRRLDEPTITTLLPAYAPGKGSSGSTLARKAYASISPSNESHSFSGGSPTSMSPGGIDDSDDEADDVAANMGQLSMNEYDHVRYHGAASGLQLLGGRPRKDERYSDGVWRFPKGMWPERASKVQGSGFMVSSELEQQLLSELPPPEEQEHLLELYWTYVHPALPVVDKAMFMESYRAGLIGGLPEQLLAEGMPSAPGQRRIPLQLLLTMFSISIRYAAHVPEAVPTDGKLWTAGEKYFFDAKKLLHRTFAVSHPSTVQTFCLMGYREIGVGAMAQAWFCIGAAIRMAQDLGMHKKSDSWSMGTQVVFTPRELQQRSKIWFACVALDKHISAYIGRPVCVTERDWDVALPSSEDPEELEVWQFHPSRPTASPDEQSVEGSKPPVAGHILSCFSHSVALSAILSRVLETMYSVKPITGRHAVLVQLEQALDKWYLELPSYLHFEPNPRLSNQEAVPPPHILTLHMKYWTTVLLLHRPFTQRAKRVVMTEGTPSPDARAVGRKSFNICTQAANRVTSIMLSFLQNWCIARAPVFLCYYVFTAATMHYHILATFPNDPQARIGLSTCVDALKRMEVVWPSAGRARDLLDGVQIEPVDPAPSHTIASRRIPSRKRSHDEHEPKPLSYAPTDGNAERRTQVSEYGVPGSAQMHPLPPLPSTSASANEASFGPYPQQHQQSPPSFDRYWSASSNSALASSLSTSVLPQQYSTGLVDSDRAVYDAVGGPIEDSRSYMSGRYPPQYWHDYSSLGQMGLPGPAVDRQAPQSQQHSSAQKQSQDQQPYYLPSQYNSFNP